MMRRPIPPHLAAGSGRLLQSAARVRPGQALVAFSLALVAFALLLQLSSRDVIEPTELLMSGGAERALMVQQRYNPRLEVSMSRVLAPRAPRAPAVRSLGGQAWKAEEPHPDPKIAFVVTTSDSLQQIRIWISYHKAIGVHNFYIFADGQAARADNVAALRAIPGVRVVLRDAELKRRHETSRIWKESWLSAFFHKPCNHELFVLQSLNMEVGIEMALQDGIDWLLHIDTDELVHPSGSPSYSLQEVLAKVPPDVDTLVFPNYESLPEREDVEDPFLEVTLFKKNYAHVVSDLYFKSYGSVARGNPNYFITYGNGKSAARVQQGMRPNGAHRWHSYVKVPKEWSSDQAAVLHFTYNRFSDLKSRRDRCDCAPTEEDAKRCFILPFDRMAFLEASLKSDDELMQWFRQRLVWSDPTVVNDLLKKGLFTRIYEPQIMIRGFIQAERTAATGSQPAPTAQLGYATSGRKSHPVPLALPSSQEKRKEEKPAGAAEGAAGQQAGDDPEATAIGTAATSGQAAAAKAAAAADQAAALTAQHQAAAASDETAAAVGTASGSGLGAAQKAAAVGAQAAATEAEAGAGAAAAQEQAAGAADSTAGVQQQQQETQSQGTAMATQQKQAEKKAAAGGSAQQTGTADTGAAQQQAAVSTAATTSTAAAQQDQAAAGSTDNSTSAAAAATAAAAQQSQAAGTGSTSTAAAADTTTQKAAAAGDQQGAGAAAAKPQEGADTATADADAAKKKQAATTAAAAATDAGGAAVGTAADSDAVKAAQKQAALTNEASLQHQAAADAQAAAAVGTAADGDGVRAAQKQAALTNEGAAAAANATQQASSKAGTAAAAHEAADATAGGEGGGDTGEKEKDQPQDLGNGAAADVVAADSGATDSAAAAVAA